MVHYGSDMMINPSSHIHKKTIWFLNPKTKFNYFKFKNIPTPFDSVVTWGLHTSGSTALKIRIVVAIVL